MNVSKKGIIKQNCLVGGPGNTDPTWKYKLLKCQNKDYRNESE